MDGDEQQLAMRGTSQGVSSSRSTPQYPETRSSGRHSIKKTHSKTRFGCKTCKRRKIKCDEGRPCCKNCDRRNLDCSYPEPIVVDPPPQQSRAPPPSGGDSDMALNLLDLELLHNFTTSTYTTLTADPWYRDLWKNTIVRQATKCEYVMRAILAVSAMHMLQLKPDQKHYLAHAVRHHQIASRIAIELMRDIQPEDYENLWLFSILTMIFSLGAPKTQQSSLFIGENVLPEWLFHVRGVRHLLSMLLQNPRNTILAPILTLGRARVEAAHKPIHRNADLLHDLALRVDQSVTDDPEKLRICHEVIKELRCHISVALFVGDGTTPPSHDIFDAFAWQYIIHEDFLPMVQRLDQEAVAIFAHSSIIFSALENQRWLQGWATFIMSRAWEVLDDEHRLWLHWPMEEIGWTP